MIRVASAGTAPWVRVLAETRSAISRQRRVYALACTHVAVVLRTGDYGVPRFFKCATCPPVADAGRRRHRARGQAAHLLLEVPQGRTAQRKPCASC